MRPNHRADSISHYHNWRTSKMEFFGAATGALGCAGLFKACVDNLELIARARGFSEDYNNLCGEVIIPKASFEGG